MNHELKIPAYIVWNNFDGELALFDTRDSSYHALNRTAAAIWRRIADGMNPTEIVDILESGSDAPRDVIEEGVTSFIADALAKGLLLAEPAA